MKRVKISHPTRQVKGSIALPLSKSVSNRMLILNAISQHKTPLSNLSDADDTHILKNALSQHTGTINVQNAGTAMRFLTAYYSCVPSNVILQGNDRMHDRPIDELVEALLQLGADIDYLDKKGYPPLRIRGKKLRGGTITFEGAKSSQFISALMLIAPTLSSELILNFDDASVSTSYITLTHSVMSKQGIQLDVKPNSIVIKPQLVNINSHYSEADWSAATYWYSMALLANDSDIHMKGLSMDSTQPDKIIESYFNSFGIDSVSKHDGIWLTKKSTEKTDYGYSCKNHPDIVPTLAATFAALNIASTITDIAHLAYKETNRIEAIVNELSACGFNITYANHCLRTNPVTINTHTIPQIRTYGDHRMAMAFAPLALIFDAIIIEDPDVVNKSYPSYWNELQNVGFIVEHL